MNTYAETALTILSDELKHIVSEAALLSVGGDLQEQSMLWEPIPGLTTALVLDFDAGPPAEYAAILAEIASIKSELDARLGRLEKLYLQTTDERHGVGGNHGPLFQSVGPLALEARQAIIEDTPDSVARVSAVRSALSNVLSNVQKGTIQGIAKETVSSWGPVVGLWILAEIHHVIPLLDRWLELVKAML